MNLDIRIIQHSEFLKTTPDGQIDLEQSKHLLLKLASLNEPPSNRNVLLDLRSTTTSLTNLQPLFQKTLIFASQTASPSMFRAN